MSDAEIQIGGRQAWSGNAVIEGDATTPGRAFVRCDGNLDVQLALTPPSSREPCSLIVAVNGRRIAVDKPRIGEFGQDTVTARFEATIGVRASVEADGLAPILDTATFGTRALRAMLDKLPMCEACFSFESMSADAAIDHLRDWCSNPEIWVAMVAPSHLRAMPWGEDIARRVGAQWSPSIRRIAWSNGAIADVYHADNWTALRGVRHHRAWLDGLDAEAHLDVIASVRCGLRLATNPRGIATGCTGVNRVATHRLGDRLLCSAHQGESGMLEPLPYEPVLRAIEQRLGAPLLPSGGETK